MGLDILDGDFRYLPIVFVLAKISEMIDVMFALMLGSWVILLRLQACLEAGGVADHLRSWRLRLGA